MATQRQAPPPDRHEEEGLTAAERDFAVVYLDTEPLRAHGWPMPRAATVTLITLAHEVGLPVCLPEPVEAELAAQFMRGFAAADEKISSAWRDVEGLFRRVNAVPEGVPHRPTAGAARAAYERAVIATRQAHRLVQAARSDRPLGEYFDLALAQSPPFDADGRGFKDAVILMSVIDDLRRQEVPRGLFVTRDTDFGGVEVLAERLGVQLIVRNVDDALTILRRRLNTAARDNYAAAERQALAVAQRELARLSQFITENLAVPSNVLADPAERLLRFLGIHVTAIKGVQADPSFSAMETGRRVKLTYTMAVQLVADVMPIPATLVPATTVKVGSTVTPATETRDELVQLLMARELHSRQGHKLVVRNVEVDAEAVRTADGFENLTPLAVRLKELDLFAEIREIVKLTDRAAGQGGPAAGQ